MKFHNIFNARNLFSLVFIISFGILLFYKLQLGVIRYVDADEFAYLHWAHNVFIGQVPLRDFQLYLLPGYLYVIAPLYFFFQDASVLISARILSWCVYVLLCIIIGYLFAMLRGYDLDKNLPFSRLVKFIFPGLILTILPLPSDKLLEIRPDTLAIAVALVGVIFQIRAMSRGTINTAWFFAGFFYSASLIILPKTLPQVGIGALVGLIWFFSREEIRIYSRMRSVLLFVYGGLLPFIAFFLWILLYFSGTNYIHQLFYELFKLPFEVNRLGSVFGMQPDLFFYPNTIYYGVEGWASVVIINHVVWIIGLLFGVVRFLTPFIPNGRRGVYAEILVAGTFISYIVMFMYGYPLRHAQYLIPIAVFVALYWADSFFSGLSYLFKSKRFWLHQISFGIIGVILIWVTQLSLEAQLQKMSWTNIDALRFISEIRQVIPKNEYVLDLIGATIYFKDPYVVSAVPFGQWQQFLSRPFPPLPAALIATDTRYIFAGNRFDTLSTEDQQYILARYTPILVAGQKLFIRR